MNKQNYDIILAGDGLLANSVLCMLRQRSLRIAWLIPANKQPLSPGYNQRTIALSATSQKILEALEIWPQLKSFVTPIKTVHVSEQGQWGLTQFHATDYSLPALGYTIAAEHLEQVLQSRDIKVDTYTELEQCFEQSETMELICNNAEGEKTKLCAELLLIAEGAHSALAKQLNIPVKTWDYQQDAVLTQITLSRSHKNIAYERFTKKAPFALLPRQGNHSALIWALNKCQVGEVLKLSDREFLQQIQQQFGYRLGAFVHATPRANFSIKKQLRTMVHHRCVLLGNTAHNLHPVVGQGFNLALYEAAWLVEVLGAAHSNGYDLGAADLLLKYQQLCKQRQQAVTMLTHQLIQLFGCDYLPVRLGRSLGLSALELISPMKQKLAKLTVGTAGKLPKLACGIAL